MYKRQSQERLETLKQELSSLREEFAGMKAQWDNEKKSVDHLSKLREEIEQVHQQIAQAQQKYDLKDVYKRQVMTISITFPFPTITDSMFSFNFVSVLIKSPFLKHLNFVFSIA